MFTCIVVFTIEYFCLKRSGKTFDLAQELFSISSCAISTGDALRLIAESLRVGALRLRRMCEQQVCRQSIFASSILSHVWAIGLVRVCLLT
jgi:hypothetical protein